MLTIKNILNGNSEGLNKNEMEIFTSERNRLNEMVPFRHLEKSIQETRKGIEESGLANLMSEDTKEKLIKTAIRSAQFTLQFEGSAKTFKEVYEQASTPDHEDVINSLIQDAAELWGKMQTEVAKNLKAVF